MASNLLRRLGDVPRSFPVSAKTLSRSSWCFAGVVHRVGAVRELRGGADHVTFSARADTDRSPLVSATTPTKLPFRTTLTPEMLLTEASSTVTGMEFTTGGRTTRP